ncbi:hypothetical protein DFH11DRAFT_1769289 [Phellopilus nigrolimitatus]|nr:hypothetical protein DFH11DRAFT_1769289 [Phellopilus nigrolimitatus]
MSQQNWPPDQRPPFFRFSAAFDFQQPDLTMPNAAPLNRKKLSNPARDLYVPSRDIDTTALQYRAPQEFSRYSEGLQTSVNDKEPSHDSQIMPAPHRPITHISRTTGATDEGISRSGPSMLIGAAQPPYLSPRGPISSILDGGTIELSRSRAPGSGRPRHEHFDLADFAAMPDPRQVNWPAPSDYSHSQENPFLLVIEQHSPSFTSLSYPASTPSYPLSSVDSSDDCSSPPRPREPDSTIFGMKESIARWASHASGFPQHENFVQRDSSIATEPASPIKQQPQKARNVINRNPCKICKRRHEKCVVVASNFGPLCEKCKKRGVMCKFSKK